MLDSAGRRSCPGPGAPRPVLSCLGWTAMRVPRFDQCASDAAAMHRPCHRSCKGVGPIGLNGREAHRGLIHWTAPDDEGAGGGKPNGPHGSSWFSSRLLSCLSPGSSSHSRLHRLRASSPSFVAPRRCGSLPPRRRRIESGARDECAGRQREDWCGPKYGTVPESSTEVQRAILMLQ